MLVYYIISAWISALFGLSRRIMREFGYVEREAWLLRFFRAMGLSQTFDKQILGALFKNIGNFAPKYKEFWDKT